MLIEFDDDTAIPLPAIVAIKRAEDKLTTYVHLMRGDFFTVKCPFPLACQKWNEAYATMQRGEVPLLIKH